MYKQNIIRTFTTRFSTLCKGALFGAAILAGCGADDAVHPDVDLIDKVSRALTVDTVRAIKGTYTNCTSRSGTWALGLNGFSPSESALSVVKNNSACSLAVTQVIAGSAMAPDTYEMAAPLTLSASYPNNGSAFMLDGTGATIFYANFRIQPNMSFSSNFTLNMVYSDDSTETTASKSAAFAVQTSSASSSNVAPPDYSISLAGLTIQVDADDVVQTASGTATLTDGMVIGETYVVDSDTLGATPTFAEIDAIYTGGTPTSLMGSNPTIPAADFNLGSADLTAGVVRNLIVANIENGTRAYQVFRITFNHP